MDLPVFNSEHILAQRPAKHEVRPDRPYAWMIEPECDSNGILQQVVTLFLTGAECRFRCTMCDLWKHTLDIPTPPGALIEQINFALQDLGINWQAPADSGTTAIKLYNSSNFFDKRAVPLEDWIEIQRLTNDFETVIVENHPGLCGKRVYEFQHGLAGQLEIALGLETVHPQVLPWLNKQMTLPQYRATVEDLVAHDVRVRTFILVKPPFLNEQEGVFWAMESMRFAFKCGVECCSMVPVRGGNGLMDRLQQDGDFTPPTVASLEQVLVAGLEMGGGRVFMDLWDSDQFLAPECCKQQRLSRLMEMNQTQQVQPEVQCDTCG